MILTTSEDRLCMMHVESVFIVVKYLCSFSLVNMLGNQSFRATKLPSLCKKVNSKIIEAKFANYWHFRYNNSTFAFERSIKQEFHFSSRFFRIRLQKSSVKTLIKATDTYFNHYSRKWQSGRAPSKIASL